jgi:hypothetical protein
MGKHLVASRDVKKGEVILVAPNHVLKEAPCRFSIQVSHDLHALFDLSVSFLNHSCEPNLFVDTQSFAIRALSDISENSPFGFFYPSTEWEMKNPFVCLCGSENCMKLVDGAKSIRQETLRLYQVNLHIDELKALQQQHASAVQRRQADAGRGARRAKA